MRIEGWLHTRIVAAPRYSAKNQRLLDEQDQIGWDQIFNGRMTNQWHSLQQEYLIRTGNLEKRRMGPIWTTTIITHTWDQWMELWAERNGVCHGIDETTKQNIQREAALAELEAIYANRNKMLPQDRDLLFPTQEEHLECRCSRGILITL
jgi:hypothetical protein